jgi:DNA repair protein RadC
MQQQFLFEADQQNHFPISQTVNDTIALYSSPMRRLADLGADALTEIEHFDNPESVYKVFGPEMRAFDREVLAVALLNTRFRLIKFEKLSLGTVNETLAHPREILKPALIHSAYAFVLVHKHPSGDATPSDTDRRLTRSVSLAASTMQIQFLDHLIMGAPADCRAGYFSFKEAGLL